MIGPRGCRGLGLERASLHLHRHTQTHPQYSQPRTRHVLSPIHTSVSESADIMVDGMAFRANFVQRTMHQGRIRLLIAQLSATLLHNARVPYVSLMSVLLVFLPMMAESSPVHPPELGTGSRRAIRNHSCGPRPPYCRKAVSRRLVPPENGSKPSWLTMHTPSGHSLMDRQSLFPVRSTSHKDKRFKPHTFAFIVSRSPIPMRLRTISALGPRPSARVPHLGARGTGLQDGQRNVVGVLQLGNAVPTPQPRPLDVDTGEVTLRAHDVQRSPFSAHMSGPSLWVTGLERR